MRETPDVIRTAARRAAAHTARRLGLFVIMAAALASCDKPATTPGVSKPVANKSDGIFPFVAGAKWVYYTETVYPSTERVQSQVFTNVETTDVLGGKEYQRVLSIRVGHDGKSSTYAYFRDSPNGVYKIDGTKRDKGEFLDTPRPLRVGDEWDINSPACVFHCVVEGIESVTLISGTYANCWKIALSGKLRNEQGEDMEIRTTIYRAPGIGDVKAVTNFQTPAGQVVTTTELAMHAIASDSGNVIPNHGASPSDSPALKN